MSSIEHFGYKVGARRPSTVARLTVITVGLYSI